MPGSGPTASITGRGTAEGAAAVQLARLRAEFVLLFVAAPAAMAVLLPPERVFTALFLLTALGIVLLHRTPGFRWSELAAPGAMPWRFAAGFTLATVVTAGAAVAIAVPEAAFEPARSQPALMAAIVLLYPLFSALPQELIYRPMFFRRYAPILPGALWPGLLLNAGVFAFAHLMYWSWLVAAMTFTGGLAFAWAYRARGSFPMALLLHAVAGWIVFGAGLGLFFYSGNVTRPF